MKPPGQHDRQRTYEYIGDYVGNGNDEPSTGLDKFRVCCKRCEYWLTCPEHSVMPLLVRTVFALQPVGIDTIAPIPHATLRHNVTMRSQKFQPVLLEKTLCISNTAEHFARQSVEMVKISDAMKERPDMTQSFSVVMELNLDRP
jgi:hypothetical protein